MPASYDRLPSSALSPPLPSALLKAHASPNEPHSLHCIFADGFPFSRTFFSIPEAITSASIRHLIDVRSFFGFQVKLLPQEGPTILSQGEGPGRYLSPVGRSSYHLVISVLLDRRCFHLDLQ